MDTVTVAVSRPSTRVVVAAPVTVLLNVRLPSISCEELTIRSPATSLSAAATNEESISRLACPAVACTRSRPLAAVMVDVALLPVAAAVMSLLSDRLVPVRVRIPESSFSITMECVSDDEDAVTLASTDCNVPTAAVSPAVLGENNNSAAAVEEFPVADAVVRLFVAGAAAVTTSSMASLTVRLIFTLLLLVVAEGVAVNFCTFPAVKVADVKTVSLAPMLVSEVACAKAPEAPKASNKAAVAVLLRKFDVNFMLFFPCWRFLFITSCHVP